MYVCELMSERVRYINQKIQKTRCIVFFFSLKNCILIFAFVFSLENRSKTPVRVQKYVSNKKFNSELKFLNKNAENQSSF